MKIRHVDQWKYDIYIERARQCLDSARRSFEASQWDSCLISSIHSAISAADAFCIHAKGMRSASDDHRDAIALFSSINPADEAVKRGANHLMKLLGIKSDAEYGDRSATQMDAENAIKAAERFLAIVLDKLPKA